MLYAVVLGLLIGKALGGHFERIGELRIRWATLAILLQVLTIIFGRDPNGGGAALWFVIGPVSIQPTEAVKVLLVVFLAAYLEENRELLAMAGRRVARIHLPPLAYLAPILVMVGAVLGAHAGSKMARHDAEARYVALVAPNALR